MPIEQFSSLISLLPEIEGVLSQKGVGLPRPSYDGAAEERESPTSEKKNIDATSEEEEEEDEED